MTDVGESFVAKVTQMRAAQKRYFKERTQQALVESKRLEKEVDALLEPHTAKLPESRHNGWVL